MSRLDARRFRIVVTAALALPGVVVALITGVSGVSAWMADRPLILAPVREPAMLTPFEAAVISERSYMIRLVRDRGARLDGPELRTLRCIAETRKDRGTIAYLAQFDSSPLTCDGVRIPN